jgi:hypothetical protein
MGSATDIVIVNVELENLEPSATAEVLARRNERKKKRRIRTYWTAKKNPGGYLDLGGGLLYVENLHDLDHRSPFGIDLNVEDRSWRSWTFDPRDREGGEVLMVLVLPHEQAADFGIQPDSAKRISGGKQLAVYWKFEKPRQSCVLRFRLRKPRETLEDEEKRLRRRSLRKRLNLFLRGSEILVDPSRSWPFGIILAAAAVLAWMAAFTENLARVKNAVVDTYKWFEEKHKIRD